ncbi:MAG: cation:proton antiporter [Bdellovibrionota bacterium]
MLDSVSFYSWLLLSIQLVLIIFSARQVGNIFDKIKLPVISGFLLTGILVGPHAFKFVGSNIIKPFSFIDSCALAFIAFMAGSEIYVATYKERLKSIFWITICHLLVIFGLCATTTYYLLSQSGFLEGISQSGTFAVAILAGTILVARSPSSVVAVVKEIRANGPFTKTILGVTVLTDVFVIAVFTICTSIAAALYAENSVNLIFLLEILINFFLSALVGIGLGKTLSRLLASSLEYKYKPIAVIIIGYISFLSIEKIGLLIAKIIGPGFFPEPLMVCMVAGFYVTNYTNYRALFDKVLHEYSSYIYIAFFTYTGLGLEISVIRDVWPIALALVLVRSLGLFIGSLIGGTIAKDPMKSNCISWMGFITQAGVGIGLAKSVELNFPIWGSEFATLIIAIIVINQLIGPTILKMAIFIMGEARPKAKKTDPNIIHNVSIFGNDSTSLALAKQLHLHNWHVQVIDLKERKIEHIVGEDIEFSQISQLTIDELRRINIEATGTVVCLFSDEENYTICQLIRQHFVGINLIVQLSSRAYQDKFHELDVTTVLPSTAMISLLDHFVRSPSAVALLLNWEDDQDVVDIYVTSSYVVGSYLKDIKLPDKILIIAAHRGGKNIVVNGNYKFCYGDTLTIVGSKEPLKEVTEQLHEI